MDTTAASIPFTAWEQAVFVALFIVMVLALLWWFTKQQANWQKFMDQINNSWRQTVKENNESWQMWLKEQNDRECDSMSKVTAAVDRLTDKLADHDAKVDDRFRDAIDAVHQNKPRIKNINKPNV